MSLCSALDPLEDFLLGATAGSSGHGLNLSTNHGLDLTCQNYEGLNLSQNGGSIQQSNPPNPASGESVVLNLAHQSLPQQLSSSGHVIQPSNINQPVLQENNKVFSQKEQQITQTFVQGNNEVGLNLSLQNGINLSRQAAQGQGNRANVELGYYYNDFDNIVGNSVSQHPMQNQNGINFTFNPRIGTDTSTYSIEQQRNSPLNLEHRSSPLNLTSVVNQPHHNSNVRNFHHSKNGSLNNTSTTSSVVHHNSNCQNVIQQNHPQQQQQQNYFPSNDQFNWSNLFYTQPEGTQQQGSLDIYQTNDQVIHHGQDQQQLFDIPNNATGQQSDTG